MEQDTLEAFAVISLVLVIIVILYLITGIIIRNKYPNSGASKVFGGAIIIAEDVKQIIQSNLENVYDNYNRDHYNSDNNDDTTIRGILHNAMQDHDRDVVLLSIVQILTNSSLTPDYKRDILAKAEAIGLVQPQTVLSERLHNVVEQGVPINAA